MNHDDCYGDLAREVFRMLTDDRAGGFVNISFVLNGESVRIAVNPLQTALSVLRDTLRLTGSKEGCGIGECGACTIIVDGLAVNSCLMFAPQLNGKRVETVEGLAGGETLHPLQQAFLDNGAVQCGFCTPGALMSSKALLDNNPRPDRKTVVKALAGNLCRCTGYVEMIDAVEDAAKTWCACRDKES